MNIIFVVIDTLRYDYIGANGNDWIQTPNLDRLAAESWNFTNSYAASFPTIPHRTDAITGRHGDPFHAWMPLPFDAVTLPGELAEMGYVTQLLHDTPHLVNGGHNFDYPFHYWTFVRGAEVDRPWVTGKLPIPENWAKDPLFDCEPQDFPSRQYNAIDPYLTANRARKNDKDWNCARLFLAARDFLRDNAARENFFLWVDCFDPHEPWDAPPEFMLKYDDTPGYDGSIDPRAYLAAWENKNLSDGAVKRLHAMYAAKVSWMDHWLGTLLDAFEETGLKKNTALVLTSDHGTNDGTGNGFCKKLPVREWEAHTPFMVYAPGAGSGTSNMIVQPQDAFATMMGMAGGKAPDETDSQDVLSLACGGKTGDRSIAISGGPPNDGSTILFTAFDGERCLEVAAKPEDCRLRMMGGMENVAADHPKVVEDLREKALVEYARRGADPLVVQWLRSEGTGPFPADIKPHRFHPIPPGYTQYFNRLYHGEFHG